MPNRERARVIVHGAVQGVGFRPFVYRLAQELALAGVVSNSAQGVVIEVEGEPENVWRFLLRLPKERPPRAIIQSLESSILDPVGYENFIIQSSDESGAKSALILPDIAPCADCLREILDPNDRRFGYPFTNCTNCGPRFSIIEALPYDRGNTSMKKFAMCAECAREYHDPADRRFHAQPNACPICGPQLALWDSVGKTIAANGAALSAAVDAVRAGKILALKGLGGFQLIVAARNPEAIARLRERKHREEKPFAIMVSSLNAAREFCHVSETEARLLESAEAPIVLLTKKSVLPETIAPGNPSLGLMLPSTALHHLFLHSLGEPIVATSGNLSDEPICIDEQDALRRLEGIADLFLVHDRPIVRQMDDSIARIIASREMILRRARGYAPLPIRLRKPAPAILALGAHLKNTVALSLERNVFVSQHLGDLATEPAYRAFVRATADLSRLYETAPALIACDLHPDYLSTKYAAQFSAPVRPVQHHWAHIAACMAENELEPPLLGISWDGTGYGDDGTIWGGEFLRINENGFTRFAHFRPFPLPGGEAAVREPRRCALGVLFEIFGDELWNKHDLLEQFDRSELALLRQILEKKINSPLTSSAGRLFDAVAALLNLRTRTSFEGQAAMELEFASEPGIEKIYPFEVRSEAPCVIDWQPMILAIIDDLAADVSRSAISAGFHQTLAEMMVTIAQRAGEERVVLSGGCFQNRTLIERAIARLSAEGFRVYWPQRIPPNDGGISLGQIFAATFPR